MSQFKFKLIIPFYSESIVISLAGIWTQTSPVASCHANHWAMTNWLLNHFLFYLCLNFLFVCIFLSLSCSTTVFCFFPLLFLPFSLFLSFSTLFVFPCLFLVLPLSLAFYFIILVTVLHVRTFLATPSKKKLNSMLVSRMYMVVECCHTPICSLLVIPSRLTPLLMSKHYQSNFVCFCNYFALIPRCVSRAGVKFWTQK